MANFRRFCGIVRCTLMASVSCLVCVDALASVQQYGQYKSESGDPNYTTYPWCDGESYNDNLDSDVCVACPGGYGGASLGDSSISGCVPGECSNNSHAATWITPVWTARGNASTNRCQIRTCNAGYHVTPNPLANLDISIDGESFDVDWGNNVWFVTFSYGTVYGEASNTGSAGNYANIVDLGTGSGSIVCRVTGFMPDGSNEIQNIIEPRWIYFATDGAEDGDLASNTLMYCGQYVQTRPEFRAAMFGQGHDLYNIDTTNAPSSSGNAPDDRFVSYANYGGNDGSWYVTIGGDTIAGVAMCSDLSGDNHNNGWGGNPADWSATQTDLFMGGRPPAGSTGGYCWCKATQITQSGGITEYVATSPWVFTGSNTGDCVDTCSGFCENLLNDNQYNPYFRDALFSGVQYGWLNSCDANIINLLWNNYSGGPSISNPSTCEFGNTNGIHPIVRPPSRTGYSFDGYKVINWSSSQ